MDGRMCLETMDERAKFLRIYANLPDSSRDEIVVVVGSEPYTWKAAKLEVEQNTPLGHGILKIMSTLKILS